MIVENKELSGFKRVVSDFNQLVKLRLSLTVVFSSVIAFLIVGGIEKGISGIIVLALGGFFVTGASNILNEVLEKDYDALMERTKNRPLPMGRISSANAVLMAGLFSIVGLMLLSLFNPIAGVLGSMAFVLYAFVYTPLKRVGSIAVYVGAIPGALPVLIGCVAAEGTISSMGIALFTIQILWQFPHFWAIGWLAYEDYNNAGYKLFSTNSDKPTSALGFLALVNALLLIPAVIVPFVLGETGIVSLIISIILTLIYSYFSWGMYKQNTRESSLKVMFFSFAYLPILLITYCIEVSFF